MAGTKKLKEGQAVGAEASRLIDQKIKGLNGWQGEALARMRALVPQSIFKRY